MILFVVDIWGKGTARETLSVSGLTTFSEMWVRFPLYPLKGSEIMKLERLVYSEYRHGKHFPIGTIILYLNNKTELAISNFHFQNGKLEVFYHEPFGKWKRDFLRNDYTKIMYDYYCKGKQKSCHINCKQLMKHDRVHKKGGGGKISPTQIVTDYECAKVPLHDFRRSMYVQYN